MALIIWVMACEPPKMMTLVASALAGGDCIDDADVLRAGGTIGVLGCVVKAPSTLGTFLQNFRWGHVRHPTTPPTDADPAKSITSGRSCAPSYLAHSFSAAC